MTKENELHADAIEIMGTTVLQTVLHVWVAKRGIYHLTGRDPGWRGAYAILATAQSVGYWADAGRQSRVDFWAKAKLLKNKIAVNKSRGK